MPTPTLTPEDKDQDERYNPATRGGEHDRIPDMPDSERSAFDDMTRGLSESEKSGNVDKNSGDSVREREAEGSAGAGYWNQPWLNNVTDSAKSKGSGRKKRGGLIGILTTLLVGGGSAAFLLGPLSMPISLMENLTLKNDSSSVAMERRFMKAFGYSTQDADPNCQSAKIKCKMGRISNSALYNLQKKGVVAYGYDGKRTGYPTRNPTGYTIDTGNGRTVNVAAKDLPGYLTNNPKIAAKVLGAGGAFNLRVKAWAGKYMGQKFFSKFNVFKRGGLLDGQSTREDGKSRTAATLDKLKSKVPALGNLEGAANGVKNKVADKIGGAKKGGVGYTLMFASCLGIKAPAYIAGGVAAVQLAQLLPLVNESILSPGSKVKASGVDLASSVSPTAVEDTMSILTEQTPRKSDGKMTSALDSKVLQSALGVNTAKAGVATKFAPGYSILTNPAVKASVDVDRSTAPACNAIMSPAAMYSAMAVDSAVTVAASATIIGGIVKIAASFAIVEIAAAVTQEFIGVAAEEAIKNLAENDNLATAEGEELGDALGVSAMSFFSAGGMARNLPTLKESQLQDYAVVQQENESFKRDMDVASLSPFDTSSRYTFLGSIVHNANIAAIQNGTYGGGFTSSLLNFAQLPFAALSNNTGASDGPDANYCTYADEFGLVTQTDDGAPREENTPAINAAGLPCTGITSGQAAMSTSEAIDHMIEEEWLDEEKAIADNSTITDLVESGYIKDDTPLSDFIESCSDASTGDYLYNSGGCTVSSSTKNTGGVTEETATCSINDETGEEFCASDVNDYDDSGSIQIPENRALEAISVFLLDYQVIQSINGMDEEDATDETISASLITGDPEELAQQIVETGNVTDRTGQIKEVAGGDRSDLDAELLGVIAGLSQSNKFTISSMKRGVISAGAGSTSLHPLGKAVDLSGSSGINGVSFGYNGTDSTIKAFLNEVAAVMPENCQIGVPNQSYVNEIKGKVASGCIVFVDKGTGAHIHLAVARN